MRQFLLTACALFALTSAANADNFPGPAVQNKAPFNSPNVMMGSNIACPKHYTPKQYATQKAQIVADVTQCINNNFGISKDIGLDFGSSKFSDCVVSSGYVTSQPADNPIWPVCCADVGSDSNYRINCRLYFAPK